MNTPIATMTTSCPPCIRCGTALRPGWVKIQRTCVDNNGQKYQDIRCGSCGRRHRLYKTFLHEPVVPKIG